MRLTVHCIALSIAIATSALAETSATKTSSIAQSTTPNAPNAIGPVQGPPPSPTPTPTPTDGKGDNGGSTTNGAQPQPAKPPPPADSPKPVDKPQPTDGSKPSPAPSDKPQPTDGVKPSPAPNDPPQPIDGAKPAPAPSDKPSSEAQKSPSETEKSSTPAADKSATSNSEAAATQGPEKTSTATSDKPVSPVLDKPPATEPVKSSPVAADKAGSIGEVAAGANATLPVKAADPASSSTKPAAATSAAAQPDSRTRAAAWRPIDRIAMVVNEDMFTSQMMQRDLNNFRVPPKDQANVLMQMQRERVTRFLEVQAGQDMGLDPALVKQHVTDTVETLIRERFNGVAGLADYMQSKDMDSNELREQLRNQVYAEIWEKYITGEAAVPGARISRDRFVRPGILQLYFENGVHDPENLEQIGGKQQEVVLQYLFIDEAQRGGEQQARDLLTTLRQRIVDGEDMGDICESYSAVQALKKEHGILPARPEARFKDLDPAVGTFLANAKPGDISELMFYKSEDGKRFWRIVKLIERTPAVLPDVQSRDVQQKLLKRIQDDYDGLRKGAALEQLFRASYVWPTELSSRTDQTPR